MDLIIASSLHLYGISMNGYLKYAARRAPLWFSIAVTSIVILLVISFISYPPGMEKFVSKGAERLIKTAEAIHTQTSDSESTPTSTGGEGGAEASTESSYFSNLLYAATLIFLNNARVNALLSVPILGTLMYGAVLVVNGWVGRYVSELLAGSQWYTILVPAVFLSPHSYLEFLAYSITVTESATLTYYILKRSRLPEYVRYYGLSLALSFAVLFVAALVEASLIL
jgi:uncharacterized membrane protein SpoIIM required for sporulation